MTFDSTGRYGQARSTNVRVLYVRDQEVVVRTGFVLASKALNQLVASLPLVRARVSLALGAA
jgi:hypothetical protein